MSDKCIAVCPKCYGWYTVSVNQPARCPQCGAVLKVLDVDYDEYCSMSEEEKAEFGERCFAALGQETKKRTKKKKKIKQKEKDTDIWISTLETLCAFELGVIIFVAVFGFIATVKAGVPTIGVLVFIAVTLIGILSVALMMVFLGMAHDLRGIRNILESSMSDEE